jgi:hypothetical protein
MPGKKSKRGRSQGPGARNGQENNSQTRSQNRARNGNNNSDNGSVATIARKLAAEMRRLDNVGPELSGIIPQRGEALSAVRAKYLTSMTMLQEEFKKNTEFEGRISALQVQDIVNSMNAQQTTEGILQANKTKIMQAVEKVKHLYEEHTTYLTDVVTLAKEMCGCPNEQMTGKTCSLSSNVPIDKQLDDLTKTRNAKVRKFNKDLDEFKATSPFGVSTPNYNYYKSLAKYNDDPEHHKHPGTHQKHHDILADHVLKGLANMNMSENVRSDQVRTGSLRYL